MRQRIGNHDGRVCKGCGTHKPADCFSPSRTGLRAMCKPCVAARKKRTIARQAVQKVDEDQDRKTINNAFNLWFGRVRRGMLTPMI